MNRKHLVLTTFLAIFFFENCQNSPRPDRPKIENQPPVSILKIDSPKLENEKSAIDSTEKTVKTAPPTVEKIPAAQHPKSEKMPTNFVDIETLDATILIDIRYATANNFTKTKIYDCPKCLLRPEAAAAIVRANAELKKQNLRLKMFDCYRPRPYQQRLWDKVPDPNYVTPPAKGSMHGRGAAVDLTIVDSKGKELEMGTPYDFFGKEAHTDFLGHPKNVLDNRKLLRETLERVGFQGIRTEWWHFSFQGKNYPLSDELWPCD